MRVTIIHHPRLHRHATISRQLIAIIVVIVLTSIAAVALARFAKPQSAFDLQRVSAPLILAATTNTFLRMFVSYIISLVVAVPLGVLIVSTPRVQRILLPIADVLQSVPVLAFFPVVVVYFAVSHDYELAAIFVIVMTMIWNIVFPVVGGLQTIPDDINSAAVVFKVSGFKRFWNITLPAIFPFIVTGSLLAWAQGWTIVIVAEVLHTYIPNGTMSQDLLGLGSLLVDSNAQGHTALFVATISAMIALVTLLNLFVWQPLLRLAQRFRFD
ncbi:MAG TPA: ABC transporter permease subunit [Candidatus Eremiobacteraceae bacterium]|nr:ABC transporter permease subunit [Candidatus Eremiobacteraceae bacterium]